MLEPCPSCAANVEFTANICPLCQADRANPEQPRAGGWKPNQNSSHSGDESTEDRGEAKKRNTSSLRLGLFLSFGGWGIMHLASKTDQFTQSIGGSDSSSVGGVLGLLMLISGLVMTMAGLFKSISK
jgi:hypothetical protein